MSKTTKCVSNLLQKLPKRKMCLENYVKKPKGRRKRTIVLIHSFYFIYAQTGALPIMYQKYEIKASS